MSRQAAASDTFTAHGPSASARDATDIDAAPVELIAIDAKRVGRIVARRDGEPTLTHVDDLAEALDAAAERDVDLVVPADLFNRLRNQFPSVLPPFVKLR